MPGGRGGRGGRPGAQAAERGGAGGAGAQERAAGERGRAGHAASPGDIGTDGPGRERASGRRRYDPRVLDRLTVDAFAPLVGEAFALDDEAGRTELVLVEARSTEPGAPAVDADGRRTPFALLFHGPAEPVLTQRIRRLEHAALGTLEIFVVPVGRDAQRVHYEAIFA